MGKRTLVMARTFDKDLDGLTKIQRKFIVPDAKFIYFRKGEAENNVPIVYAILVLAGTIYQLVALYPDFKRGFKEALADIKRVGKQVAKLFRSKRQRKRLPDIREIACPNDPDITITLEVLRSIGGDVRYLPESQRGRFRYFVNDRQYCLFVRRSNGRFSGIVGNAPKIVAALKEAFEFEWESLTPIQGGVETAIPGIRKAKRWNSDISSK